MNISQQWCGGIYDVLKAMAISTDQRQEGAQISGKTVSSKPASSTSSSSGSRVTHGGNKFSALNGCIMEHQMRYDNALAMFIQRASRFPHDGYIT